jgi:hypothetical protein
MRNPAGPTDRAIANIFRLFTVAVMSLALSLSARADSYGVSAACGRNYDPNVIRIDGYEILR